MDSKLARENRDLHAELKRAAINLGAVGKAKQAAEARVRELERHIDDIRTAVVTRMVDRRQTADLLALAQGE